jgi:hypothetical protein
MRSVIGDYKKIKEGQPGQRDNSEKPLEKKKEPRRFTV